MRRGEWSLIRVGAWIGLGIVFAVAYDAVALLPYWGVRIPLAWAARIQDWGQPLRFGLALAALAAPWWALSAVHGSPSRIRSPAVRRRAAWVAWTGTTLVLALLVAPSLFLLL
ncbi:hypothetical protein [Deferrisoma camini]|uniref:hypothetical protein n=1 Tax=Deferrisoma camini TaxID=1035120 RepID=UPI00046D7DA1|nr:hypothetical protein [Deferrisoma camini]